MLATDWSCRIGHRSKLFGLDERVDQVDEQARGEQAGERGHE